MLKPSFCHLKRELFIWLFKHKYLISLFFCHLFNFRVEYIYLKIKKAPIVCAVTSSYLNFYCKKERKFLPGGEIIVKILPPIQTRGLNISDATQLIQNIQSTVQKEFNLLNNKINLDKKYLAS